MGKKASFDRARLKEIISGFTGTKILVIGDLMVDRYFWGQVRRISPEAPVPVVDVKKETRRLGGAANVAYNIRELGGSPVLCGVAGKDYEGEWLLDELQRLGIDHGGVVLSPDVPTTVKSRVVAHSQQVVRFDREQRGKPPADVVEDIFRFLRTIWRDVQGVIVSDYGKGVVDEDLMDRIRSQGKRKRLPVAVDPKSLLFDIYRRATVITPNFQEALAAASMTEHGSEAIDEVGGMLLKSTRADSVLVTRGEDGMSLFEKSRRPFHIPTVAREVYDVTGAGDTVIGTLCLAISAGASLREAAFLANCSAGIVVAEFGTVPATRRQLLDSLPRRIK